MRWHIRRASFQTCRKKVLDNTESDAETTRFLEQLLPELDLLIRCYDIAKMRSQRDDDNQEGAGGKTDAAILHDVCLNLTCTACLTGNVGMASLPNLCNEISWTIKSRANVTQLQRSNRFF